MKKIKKYIYLSHRYLGIILAPIILLWCCSGLVMMYVPYPQITEAERIQLLPEITDFNCCHADFYRDVIPFDFKELSIEVLNEKPVIKIKDAQSKYSIYDLNTQLLLQNIDQEVALSIAKKAFPFSVKDLKLIDRDQWTVYSKYNKSRPLYKASFSDDEESELYISSINGEIVQLTTAFQRNWSWIGAVTHWLYPTFLRKHTSVWYWLVVGLTIFSLILLCSGVWLGIKQLKKRKNKPLSPYKGIRLLHHWGGVVISFFLFIFLLSGLLSMNPWGLLESKRYSITEAIGKPVASDKVISSLMQYSSSKLEDGLTQLKLADWNNEVYWLGTYKDGSVIRYDKHFELHPITIKELISVGHRLGGEKVVQSLLTEEDRYYFGHKALVELPVWKIQTNNDQAGTVLFYFSPVTGKMIKSVDSNGRIYRWLFNALHRWDFSQTLRQRPIWDFTLVPVMVLLIVFGLTGCYLGWRRLKK